MNQLERYQVELQDKARLDAKLAGHVYQVQAVRVLQGISAAGGIVGAAWQGVPSILIGAGLVWFFQQALPGIDPELDKHTGRGT